MRTSIVAILPLAFFLALPNAVRRAHASPPAVEVPGAHAEPIYRVAVAGLPSMGDSRALVTVVAFSDYECPFSRRSEATLAALRGMYGSDLRVVVAERPLPMHSRARPAALAALAADAQGAYESMRRGLYAGSVLDVDTVTRVADGLHLDAQRLSADVATVASAALERSEKLADALNVRATPTFFVNGRRIAGAQPLEVFKAVVDERLAAARALIASGVRADDVYETTVAAGKDRVPDEGGEESCARECDAHAEASPTL